MARKQKMPITANGRGAIAPMFSEFSDSKAYAKGDANEFRGKAGAARVLRKMKTWTRRVTRTRDQVQLAKMFADIDNVD